MTCFFVCIFAYWYFLRSTSKCRSAFDVFFTFLFGCALLSLFFCDDCCVGCSVGLITRGLAQCCVCVFSYLLMIRGIIMVGLSSRGGGATPLRAYERGTVRAGWRRVGTAAAYKLTAAVRRRFD